MKLPIILLTSTLLTLLVVFLPKNERPCPVGQEEYLQPDAPHYIHLCEKV